MAWKGGRLLFASLAATSIGSLGGPYQQPDAMGLAAAGAAMTSGGACLSLALLVSGVMSLAGRPHRRIAAPFLMAQ